MPEARLPPERRSFRDSVKIPYAQAGLGAGAVGVATAVYIYSSDRQALLPLPSVCYAIAFLLMGLSYGPQVRGRRMMLAVAVLFLCSAMFSVYVYDWTRP